MPGNKKPSGRDGGRARVANLGGLGHARVYNHKLSHGRQSSPAGLGLEASVHMADAAAASFETPAVTGAAWRKTAPAGEEGRRG
jgi:hypothetical protein